MGLPAWSLTLVIWLMILGFPIACALAWAFDVTSKGIVHTPADTAPGNVTAGASPKREAADGSPSMAVLPFTDMSPEHDQEYFCDGIAEEITNALCFIRNLRITSRTSAFQFKDKAVDVREIGKRLGVETVLEGSVRKSGNHVRITAQLLKAADGYHLWSQTYDRELDDVFAIQSDIAQRIVEVLRVSLTPTESALIERGGTSNARAYDYFLRGRRLLYSYSDSEEAAQMFRRAIAHDSSFAQAHAGLAMVLALRALWRLRMAPADYTEALAASQRAIELEPLMPEAYMARACFSSTQGRNDDAERDFEEAIRLNPSSYYTYYLYGRHYLGIGELAKAAELFRASARLEPTEYTPLGMLATTLQQMGETEERQRVAAQALQAIESHLEREPADEAALSRGAVCAAWLGEVDRAEELAERALDIAPRGWVSTFNAACVYAILGRTDRAIELLEIVVEMGEGQPGWIEHDQDLASLRGDPRFQAIVDRLRVPPQSREHVPGEDGPKVPRGR